MKKLPKLAKFLMAAAAFSFAASPSLADTVTVGGKDFTEQLILAELTKQLLESKGYTVDKKDGMGTNIVRAALENGEVDLYWEYTGTSLVTFNKVTESLSPEDTYARVKELDGQIGLVWLAPSKANNTYAFAIRPGNENTEGWVTISDMASAYNEGAAIAMGTSAEFPKRQDGLLGLQERYEFEAGRANVRPLDGGLGYQALVNGDLDVLSVAATDGLIAAHNLQLLIDDKAFFPDYALAPVIRQDVLEAKPELQAILETVSVLLDDATMQRLNAEVAVEKKAVEAVAADYLKSAGL